MIRSFKPVVIIISVLMLCSSVVYAAVETQHALNALQSRQFSEATQHSVRAKYITRVFSTLTFHRIPPIEIWHETLQVIEAAAPLPELTQKYVKSSFQQESTTPLLASTLTRQLFTTSEHTQNLQHALKKTPLLQHWADQQLAQHGVSRSTTEVAAAMQDSTIVLTHFLQGDHKYLILLQNSEELRATGGFIGSYAVVELHDGQLQNIKIRDIYDADGQFQGFVEAPPGLGEYLSSGHGMRLPDANWNPDFPSSAQEMLQFFSQAKETGADGVIALNLSVVQKIIEETGPIYLPDYQQTVTADNLPLVARADRTEFFAGSQQKKNFLQALLTQLKIQMQELSLEQQLHIMKLLAQETQKKNIQVFSHTGEIQKLFQKYRVAGEVTKNNQPFSLFIVESNVGINKSNQKITRQVELQSDDQEATLRLQYVNYNDSTRPTTKFIDRNDPNLHYINYLRIFLPPDVEVRNISLNDQVIDKKDERVITMANGEQFKEVGFLAPVPEKTEATVQVTLHLPEHLAPLQQLFIQKQSGLPPVSYSLQRNNKLTSFTLEKDTLIE